MPHSPLPRRHRGTGGHFRVTKNPPNSPPNRPKTPPNSPQNPPKPPSIPPKFHHDPPPDPKIAPSAHWRLPLALQGMAPSDGRTSGFPSNTPKPPQILPKSPPKSSQNLSRTPPDPPKSPPPLTGAPPVALQGMAPSDAGTPRGRPKPPQIAPKRPQTAKIRPETVPVAQGEAHEAAAVAQSDAVTTRGPLQSLGRAPHHDQQRLRPPRQHRVQTALADRAESWEK